MGYENRCFHLRRWFVTMIDNTLADIAATRGCAAQSVLTCIDRVDASAHFGDTLSCNRRRISLTMAGPKEAGSPTGEAGSCVTSKDMRG